jgi:hypothetical protein
LILYSSPYELPTPNDTMTQTRYERERRKEETQHQR